MPGRHITPPQSLTINLLSHPWHGWRVHIAVWEEEEEEEEEQEQEEQEEQEEEEQQKAQKEEEKKMRRRLQRRGALRRQPLRRYRAAQCVGPRPSRRQATTPAAAGPSNSTHSRWPARRRIMHRRRACVCGLCKEAGGARRKQE